MINQIDIQLQEAQVRLMSALQKLSDEPSSDPNVIKRMSALNIRLAKPVKMALAGEFSSGKTTLARMLLGRDYVTTKAAASAMPTVLFQYGKHEKLTLVTGKKWRGINRVDDLSEDEMRAANFLSITVDLPLLKRIEVFDTPGTSDPSRSVNQIEQIAKNVDFAIWCTNATQAWRQSEVAMWDEMPEVLRKRSVLLVTHVDLPKVKQSLPRLMARMHKEAGPHFGKVLAIDLLSAITSRLDASFINDPVKWTESGGEACFAAINEVADAIKRQQLEEVEELFKDEAVVQMLARIPDKTEPVAFIDLWSKNVGNINSTNAEDHLKVLSGIKDGQLGTWKETGEAKSEIQARLHEAVVFLHDADLASDSGLELVKGVIAQLDWEFRSIVDAEAA